MAEIDRTLGYHSPPAIEYVYVEPYLNVATEHYKISANPYGHGCIRYTLPNGEQTVCYSY